MSGANFIQGWTQLVESLATIGIIVIALCLMLGIVERSDILKHIGAIFGIAIVLILIPAMLLSTWTAMSFWQRIGVAALGFAVLLFRQPPRRGSPKKKRE
jgi:hypothetical protein